MNLFNYQTEVIQPALEGKNIIIWLPTGGGKTRAAVYVAKRHLETRANAKVAVLVNKVHLVDQHYEKEFKPFLKMAYRIAHISGDSDQKEFFTSVVQNHDIIICTAQILENALNNTEKEKHVELTDFTLLIIDECHHTQKDAVYNKIMERYVSRKLRGLGGLPQVLGLTASPGTGGNKTFDGAKQHVLQICANLDASAIMSCKVHVEDLEKKVPKPRKQYDIVNDREEDPFGDKLKEIMRRIHDYMDVDGISRAFGTQDYEQEVVLLEKTGAEEGNRRTSQCALHLRKYNDALLIHDTVRMIDAFRVLEDYYSGQRSTRMGLDHTDRYLFTLFKEHEQELEQLAELECFENPKLAVLESTLLEQFVQKSTSRGILFSKTRTSTHCLHDWVRSNPRLQKVGIQAAILTGAGISNQAGHMTQRQQKNTIQDFRNGHLNLLISTSVAEEGLDIRECNLVVRYGLITNEIAMKQASGRARASNSVYSVVASQRGPELRKEKVNECLEKLMERAIEEVQHMAPREYMLKIQELQKEAVIMRRLAEEKVQGKRRRYEPAAVRLYCRRCQTAVCHGSDLQVIESTHYVNVNPHFEIYYIKGGKIIIDRKFEDWEPGCKISCADCGQEWGMEMIYKGVFLPNLAIKNFILETPDDRKSTKKWKDIPFLVSDFDYVQYCERKFSDSLADLF
ncbi:ATP-dependent RNA helicase DHX58 [Amia ocellicauda]|uniref:ATP-dependent RNA helicase DHX58 n=1 Tax=Amia ocellicauda TaxID=2972642 RepID=UPI0034639465